MSHPTLNTRALVSALKLIAGKSCSNYTTGPGTCIAHKERKRNSPYGAVRWCDACIALDGLRKAESLAKKEE